MKLSNLRVGEGVSGKAVAEGRVIIVGDYHDAAFQHDELANSLAEGEGIRDLIVAPIIGDAGPLGAIEVFARLFALAGVLALAVWIAISPWAPWQSPPALVSPRRLSAELGMDGVIPTDAGLALSPDGSVLAFQAEKNGSRQLYIRRLDQLQAFALPGTVGAAYPFFSPDGQWIGFFAEGKLKKVAVTGGAAVPICDAPDPRGGAWGEDGDIVFNLASSDSSPRNALLRVSSDGGTPQPATTLTDDEVTHRWPQVLPGSESNPVYRAQPREQLRRCQHRGSNAAERTSQDRPAWRKLREIRAERPSGLRARRDAVCCAVRSRGVGGDWPREGPSSRTLPTILSPVVLSSLLPQMARQSTCLDRPRPRTSRSNG